MAFFFTFQSGKDPYEAYPISQRTHFTPLKSEASFPQDKLERSQKMIQIEGEDNKLGHKKQLSESEQQSLEWERIKGKKYHDLQDLEMRISLHKDDPNFPLKSYQQEFARIKHEIASLEGPNKQSH